MSRQLPLDRRAAGDGRSACFSRQPWRCIGVFGREGAAPPTPALASCLDIVSGRDSRPRPSAAHGTAGAHPQRVALSRPPLPPWPTGGPVSLPRPRSRSRQPSRTSAPVLHAVGHGLRCPLLCARQRYGAPAIPLRRRSKKKSTRCMVEVFYQECAAATERGMRALTLGTLHSGGSSSRGFQMQTIPLALPAAR
jgi:hypothetical protein